MVTMYRVMVYLTRIINVSNLVKYFIIKSVLTVTYIKESEIVF